MNSNLWEGKRVIIVDDSKLAREDLKAKFTSFGLQVVGEAVDGIQALEVTHALIPDIVSLDIIMPEMHGIEVLNRIRSDFSQIKCCIISCLTSEQKVKEAYKDKYDLSAFFNKPLDPDTFKLWLKRSFEKSQDPLKLVS